MTNEQRQYQQQLLELLRDPQASDAAIEDLYLRFVGPHAWTMAWQGLKEEGRGAVVFDMRGRDWRSVGMKPVDAYYVPENTLLENADVDVSVEVAVGTYDPRHELVCIVIYDTGLSCSRLSRRDLAA